jgi:acyl-CoA thioester hydrolase
MPAEYRMRLPVRRYEVDRFGFVHNHIYQQYLEEAAIQASAAAGVGPDWYHAHGTVWVIREIALEYLHPATLDDELEISTWVSDFRRVRSHREYAIHRVSDGQLLVHASTDWVYIDRARLWPIRIPAEVIAAFAIAEGNYVVPPARPVPATPPAVAKREWSVRRRAQRHEIDGMGHVNNAFYVTWFEQAILDTLAAWLPAEANTGWPCWRRHDIEYLSAILPGEEVEIVTRLVGMGQARAAWQQEVRRAGSADAAIKDQSVVLYLDTDMRPQRWSGELLS